MAAISSAPVAELNRALTENNPVIAGDLTLVRLSRLPWGARRRTERTVLFICIETGQDYRFEADQLFTGSHGEVLATVESERFLMLPSGDKVHLRAGIWRIDHL